MFQYRPEYLAGRYSEINRRLKRDEMERAAEIVKELGFRNALVG
jgi:putative pyruvate formate lyase activating enzyme